MNKQEYLTARAQWKANYLAMQQLIRDRKHAIREAHRALGRCGLYDYSYPSKSPHNAKWYAASCEVGDAVRALTTARKAMSAHLDVLGALKEEARKAWEAREVVMA